MGLPDDATARRPEAEPDRLAQPVDAEQPPRLPFPVVGIGASAGGLEAVGEFLDVMPPDSGMAFVLVQHPPPDRESHMAEVLGRRTAMPVVQVEDGTPVEPDHVYVIRPGHVPTIRDGRLHLGPPLGSPRAADRPIDDFFRSLAEEQRERAVCVILSGMGSNGAAGAQAVKAVGGLCIAQDPESAQFPSMPQHLIDAGCSDYILRPADLPDVLLGYAGRPSTGGGREADAEAILGREGRLLREILAILRTRTRQDFAGYKEPMLLRRVQRRMGLTRVSGLAEYARLLRQSPSEVTALADDLLIRVTGFFRDPNSWEALRRQVIAPLVEAREPGGPVRAWVTACSSGEEAYSLAMLLAEEALRESEEQFRRAIEEAPIPVIMHAEDGEVLQVSRTWTELTGYALADLPTVDAWLSRAYGPGADAVRDHVHELFRGDRKTLNVEFVIRTRGGADRHWSFNASAPGTLRDGRRFVVGMAVDITDRKRAEDELRAGEERLRLIVESALDYSIFTLDADRLVTSWSPGSEAIFGYTSAEMLGRPADVVFTPEDRAAGVPEEEVRTALREGRAADERWHLRKDGTRFFASGVLTPLGDGGARGFVKVLRDLTERKRMEDELREARDELERRVSERTAELAEANEALRDAMAARTELLRRLVTAQEDERRRLSRELHDGMGQELTALSLGLKNLERTIPEDAPGRARLLEIGRIVDGIGRAAHDLAVELRPTALDDIGLDSALAAYVGRWSERAGVVVDFRPVGLKGERLPPEVETAVYRIVQEALNNVAKHAGASRVGVMLSRHGDELVTLVEDDGRGFDPGRTGEDAGRRSLGLLGMRERVGLVGGTLVVESGVGEGTVVRARIPLPRRPGEAGRRD